MLAVVCALAVAAAQGQAPSLPAGVPVLRLDAGILDPDVPAKGVGALGGSIGWTPGGANTVLLRYLRQSQSRNAGSVYVADHSRGFLLLQWEHAFGSGELLHRQFATRVGLGVLSANQRPAAGVVSGGVALRYPVAPKIALVGGIEDNLAILPHRAAAGCYEVTPGQSTCATPPSGGWQHNFGVLAGLEWWPSARPFGESAPVPEPAAPELSSPPPFTTETPTGAVCARLDIPAGLLVRVSTYANGGREGSGTALMVRRGSQVGALIRCGNGTLVMGPSAAQETLDLTIFEQWIYRVWTQGHSGLKGAAVGAGTGAVLGFLIGSLKSDLCNGTLCARHRLSATVIGAASAGLVGWVFGRATPRWIRRYR